MQVGARTNGSCRRAWTVPHLTTTQWPAQSGARRAVAPYKPHVSTRSSDVQGTGHPPSPSAGGPVQAQKEGLMGNVMHSLLAIECCYSGLVLPLLGSPLWIQASYRTSFMDALVAHATQASSICGCVGSYMACLGFMSRQQLTGVQRYAWKDRYRGRSCSLCKHV